MLIAFHDESCSVHLDEIDRAASAHPPSTVAGTISELQYEQKERPIYNGRPAKNHRPSIALYDPCLARLKDGLDGPSASTPTAELAAEELKDTHDFFLESSKIYDTETKRITGTK